MSFKEQGYEIIKGAISKDVCKLLAEEFRIAKEIAVDYNKHNPSYKSPDALNPKFPFGDEMVQRSFSWYSPLCFEALSNSLIKSAVEKVLGEEVYPTYSYARIYYYGAEMKKHTDRSSSEFSVSCCISVDADNTDWFLEVEDRDKNIIRVEQEPGDAIMYMGNELAHWRRPYTGKEQINAFMFYVRKHGEKQELKYDTRPMLGLGPQSRTMTSEQQWEKYSSHFADQ